MTIRINNVTYAYRRWSRPVLADFTYALPDGLSVLLGPNGAGKSTLLKLAAGTAHPTSGTITLDATPSTASSYRRAVGWLPQHVQPIPQLTAREYVAYAGWLKGMRTTVAHEKAAAALADVNLTEHADVKTHRLSGGQLRRLGVAATLVHDARVLLLEPDRGTGFSTFSPRVMINESDLAATRLVQPASRIRWRFAQRRHARDRCRIPSREWCAHH